MRLPSFLKSVSSTAIIIHYLGRHSAAAAREKLELETLADRRTKIRHALLLRLLSHKENNDSLTSAYDELINDTLLMLQLPGQ